mmetsp:Transcript_117682/g.293411  ORF Transcript_117682/g.293411 Transcript_117682/m.293411 type:complete len:204 (+) Transcript_117682:811-1422(+)
MVHPKAHIQERRASEPWRAAPQEGPQLTLGELEGHEAVHAHDERRGLQVQGLLRTNLCVTSFSSGDCAHDLLHGSIGYRGVIKITSLDPVQHDLGKSSEIGQRRLLALAQALARVCHRALLKAFQCRCLLLLYLFAFQLLMLVENLAELAGFVLLLVQVTPRDLFLRLLLLSSSLLIVLGSLFPLVQRGKGELCSRSGGRGKS